MKEVKVMIDRISKRLEKYEGSKIELIDKDYVITYQGKEYKDTSANRLWRTFNNEFKDTIVTEEVKVVSEKKIIKDEVKVEHSNKVDDINFRTYLEKKVIIDRYLYGKHASTIKGVLKEVVGNLLVVFDPVRKIRRHIDRNDIISFKTY